MSSNTLYILRGLPGSGKTTLANLMVIAYNCVEVHAVAHAADDYFTDDYGNYNYVREEVSRAHEWCQGQVDMEMRSLVPVVIVHNTFTRRSEIQPYQDLADRHSYFLTEIVCKGNFQNQHGVSDDVIEKFRARWED